MGYYLNGFMPLNKVGQILKSIPGSEIIDPPEKWEEDLVVVVSNGAFEAAGYAYSEEEMKEFLGLNSPDDKRPRTWMKVPGAAKLSKYK